MTHKETEAEKEFLQSMRDHGSSRGWMEKKPRLKQEVLRLSRKGCEDAIWIRAKGRIIAQTKTAQDLEDLVCVYEDLLCVYAKKPHERRVEMKAVERKSHPILRGLAIAFGSAAVFLGLALLLHLTGGLYP